MLATFAGFLSLLLGLLLLLLPLLVSELSRPRDSAWGAVVLLLGLVLVTSAERLTGAPMLAVLCAGLLVGRLGGEVAQGRWRALSEEERLDLGSAERWSRSINQLAASAASLVQGAVALTTGLTVWLRERRQGRSHGKRWVRADASPAGTEAAAADVDAVASAASDLGPSPVAAAAATEASVGAQEPPPEEGPPEAAAAASESPAVVVVGDFSGIDALLAAAPEPQPSPPLVPEP